jgi:hypothetical protein
MGDGLDEHECKRVPYRSPIAAAHARHALRRWRPERELPVTGRHRLPEDWRPERVEVLDHPSGPYTAEWSYPTAAGLRLVRVVRLDGGVEIFQAITGGDA